MCYLSNAGFVAAVVQLGVLCCGLTLLAFQRVTAAPGSLNDAPEKPAFDEVRMRDAFY